MLRLGGFGAIAGGLLWFVGLAAAGQSGGDDATWGPVIAAGTVGLLLALVGLSAFQAQHNPRLAWAAFAIPAIGTIVSVVGLIAMSLWPEDTLVFGSFSAWYLWVTGLLAMLVGSIIFAFATIRAAVFSRRAAQGLAISSAAVTLIAFGTIGGASDSSAIWIFAIATGSFAISWIALGIMALRRGPIRAVATAGAEGW